MATPSKSPRIYAQSKRSTATLRLPTLSELFHRPPQVSRPALLKLPSSMGPFAEDAPQCHSSTSVHPAVKLAPPTLYLIPLLICARIKNSIPL